MSRHLVSYFVILALWTGSTLSDGTKDETVAFTVGVIANGSGPVKSVSVVKFGYNITSVWSLVDTSEPFRVFTAVQRFVRRPAIDAILLFDWDSRLHQHSGSFTNGNKQLIVVDELTLKYNNKENDMSTSRDDVHECAPTLLQGESYSYCETDIDGESEWITSNAMASSIGTKALSQLIVGSLHWTHVYILHDDATEKATGDLVDALSLGGVLSAIYNIDTVSDFNATLAEIYQFTIRHAKPQLNFAVMCWSQGVTRILKIANRFDSHKKIGTSLLNQFSSWLVVEFGRRRDAPHIFRKSDLDLNNVVILAIPDVIVPTSRDVANIMTALVVDLNCKANADPRLVESVTKTDILDLFLKKAMTWHPSARCQGYKLDTLMWTPNRREFNTVGSVDIRGNVNLQSELFPNIKFGYNKRHFTVTTLPWDPFVIRHAEIDKDDRIGKPTGNVTLRYEGSTIELLQALARVLNFTYTLIEPVDQKWGSVEMVDNLTFNGMIGQVQRLECDFAAAPLTIQPFRESVVDFTQPIFYDYTTVLVKRIDPQTLQWRTLIDPLRWEVLISIGVGLAIVTLLLYLLERFHPFYDTLEHREWRIIHGGLHDLPNCFCYMFGCVLFQGGVHLPGAIAGRTLVSCWWLTCMVVVGIYCGNLVAFLTVSTEKPPFNTLEEMVQRKDYKYGTLGDSSWHHQLKTSSNPISRKVWDGIRRFQETDPGVLHIDYNYHLDRVRNGGYGWIGDSQAMDVVMATDCDLIKINQQFLSQQYGFAFPESSLHVSIFSEQIMAMHESGLFKMWKRKWWPKSNLCAWSKVAAKSTPISIINVQSAFYVCVLGACVGTLAVVVERIVYIIRRRRLNDDDEMQSQSIRNNLVVGNITEVKGETHEQSEAAVKQLCIDHLKIADDM